MSHALSFLLALPLACRTFFAMVPPLKAKEKAHHLKVMR
jgi:hypothetical protein